MSDRALASALQLHQTAARALVAAVDAIPPSAFAAPLAEGKWSPEQIVEHLISTYDIILSELGGGGGMQIRTKWWQQILLKVTIAPRILRGRGFPKGAKAPRELRPGSLHLDPQEGLRLFSEKGARLEMAAKAAEPQQRITHAYFGRANVATGVTLCARHIEHHTAQLQQ